LLNRKISSSLAEISECALSKLRSEFREMEIFVRCKKSMKLMMHAVHEKEQRECKEREK